MQHVFVGSLVDALPPDLSWTEQPMGQMPGSRSAQSPIYYGWTATPLTLPSSVTLFSLNFRVLCRALGTAHKETKRDYLPKGQP